MLHPNPEKSLRAHYAHRTRSLEQAARAAHEIAAVERLPIHAAHTGDPEQWHREAILKTVPVYGKRQRHQERVPQGARILGDRAEFDQGTWSELQVKGSDFQRYLEWLHSFW